MLAMWVKVRVKPEARERFLKAIEVDALGSERDEAGCMRFNVLQDGEDQNVYYFYEVYRDEAALEAHRAAPHYAVWRAAADTLGRRASGDALPDRFSRCGRVLGAKRLVTRVRPRASIGDSRWSAEFAAPYANQDRGGCCGPRTSGTGRRKRFGARQTSHRMRRCGRLEDNGPHTPGGSGAQWPHRHGAGRRWPARLADQPRHLYGGQSLPGSAGRRDHRAFSHLGEVAAAICASWPRQHCHRHIAAADDRRHDSRRRRIVRQPDTRSEPGERVLSGHRHGGARRRWCGCARLLSWRQKRASLRGTAGPHYWSRPAIRSAFKASRILPAPAFVWSWRAKPSRAHAVSTSTH